MAITKTARAIVAADTAVAAGNSAQGSIDLRNGYGFDGVLRITNGATGPTIGCSAIVEYSNDNTTWREVYRIMHVTTANATLTRSVSIPAEVMYARVTFSGHTGQGVTVDCLGSEITGL